MLSKVIVSFGSILNYIEKQINFQNKIKWSACLSVLFHHFFGAYWCYCYAFPVKWQSIVFVLFMIYFNLLGITAGVHRYWTHRTYKIKRGIQIFLMIAFTSAGQNSIRDWVRDHRLHHKYSDTDADPHNANRGFFFSHIGWQMLKKNQQVLTEGKKIDLSDLEDPMLRIHHKYFIYYKILLCFVLPTVTGIVLWGENWRCAVAWQCFIRYLYVLHGEMTVNSVAHIYGYRPYNKDILPVQSKFVSTWTGGEGWHNYHHMFPYDFRTSEFTEPFDVTTKFIRLLARLGWAYDLKEASPDTIKAVTLKLGDGSTHKD
ncbi:hypothetical protein K1T71_012529 [Dendrolimus kikuchii]|uniref:Uncharacterized protein n=1 Tax=Dendrolimus kikuchii TaxID=765133 RepID=A0ACC1CJL4_9NEOP|nr:hypothetical protein K1T71_012529 [Dendrolimus kikuchii]